MISGIFEDSQFSLKIRTLVKKAKETIDKTAIGSEKGATLPRVTF